MKKTFILFCSLLLIVFISCSKDKNYGSNGLIGIWTNPDNFNNTIDFIDTENVKINGFSYSYKIVSDSIYFSYTGSLIDMIYCPGTYHKIIIDYQTETIKIKDLNKMCMISGDSGFNTFQKAIVPNKFIGFWVSNDNLDTMIITTNNSFERPRDDNFHFDFYSGFFYRR